MLLLPAVAAARAGARAGHRARPRPARGHRIATSTTSSPLLTQLLLYLEPGRVLGRGGAGRPAQTLILLNPLTTIIEGVRWSLLGEGDAHAGVGDRVLRRCDDRRDLVVGLAVFARRESSSPMSSEPAVTVSDVSKVYKLGLTGRTTRCSRSSSGGSATRSAARAQARAVPGARRRQLRRRAGRGRRRHRPQRRGEEHAVQDPEPHHAADRGARRHGGQRRVRCSRSAPASTPSSPGSRTSTSTARSSGCAATRSTAGSRRSSTSPRCDKFLDTPVKRYCSGMQRAARLRGGRAPRARDPHHRRGARGRRRRRSRPSASTKMKDGRVRRRPHGALREPQPRHRSSTSAPARCCSPTGGWSSTARPRRRSRGTSRPSRTASRAPTVGVFDLAAADRSGTATRSVFQRLELRSRAAARRRTASAWATRSRSRSRWRASHDVDPP